MKQIRAILIVACIVRIAWAIFGWKTSLLESFDHSITITYQKSAYLIAFGYGYAQTLVDSPSDESLQNAIDKINAFKKYSLQLNTKDIYATQHYPPLWSLTAAGLYKITHLPVAYLMQLLGIIADLFAICFLFKILLFFTTQKLSLICLWIYALFPPLIASSVAMTPDAFMSFFILAISYFFLKEYFTHKNIFKTIIIVGLLNGMCALLRPDAVLTPFFLSLLFLIFHFSTKLKTFLIFNLGVTFITTILLLPWALRNQQLTGHLLFSSTSFGATCITGLAALPNPWNLGASDLDRREEAKLVGMQSPFEYEANTYFTNRWKMYVKQEPLFYLKTILYRTVYFILTPYNWGIEKKGAYNSFSQSRTEGSLFQKIPELISSYWDVMLSIFFSICSLISASYLLIKRKQKIFLTFSCLLVLNIFLSHIFIYITSTYLIPLIFIQIACIVFAWDTFTKYRNQTPHGITK